MEKKRIVLVSHNDRRGGAAIVTYRLMKTLQSLGHEADMLVFEKGLYTSVKDMAFSVFKEGRKIDSISINVLRNGKTVRMFFATGGIVVRREYSPLDSINGGVFLEYLQVAHTGITEIPLPLGM